MQLRQVITLILVGALQGCVSTSSIPVLPDSLDGDGLLVGKIYMPGSYRWDSSQVIIDGRTYNASLRDGYLAIKLAPGEHTFQSLRTLGWNEKISMLRDDSPYVKVRGGGGYRAPTYTYIPGSTTVTQYTLLPINQKFTIKADRLTSIGMYVFLVDPKDKKKFYTIRLDNKKEMAHFLDTNYPKLMGTLTEHDFLPVEAKYLDGAKLPELRKVIAANEIMAGHYYQLRAGSLVYGGAGTVVVLAVDKNSKEAPPVAQVIDTGTLADINDIQLQGDRVSLLTADAQVLILDGGQVTHRTMPYRVQPLHFRRFGAQGIVAVDNRRRFLTSQDDGQNWTKDETALLEEPTNRLDVFSVRDGIYVYAKFGVPDYILLRSYTQPTQQQIPVPTEHGRIPAWSRARLFATEAGLYIDYLAPDFHFKPNGQNEWQLRAMPADKCGYIGFEATGRTLNVTCDKVGFRSDDGGQTWTRREPAAGPAPATPST